MSLTWSLSSPDILLDTPPPFVEFGIKTKNLPAKDSCVDNAAPLVPRSSLRT